MSKGTDPQTKAFPADGNHNKHKQEQFSSEYAAERIVDHASVFSVISASMNRNTVK